ncbi:MAG TPA: DUF2760 domain-containing protein [Polyangiales bacterium]|nr:DUF2760 domain-containing protein [Polyangiales bacterium]
MTDPNPSFFARFALAFAAFFKVLFDATYAGRLLRLQTGEPTPPPPPPAPEPAKLREVPTDSALQLLGLLQREGRLIDFLQEDLGAYPDAAIGATARVMHSSVRKALLAHVSFEPVRTESEGSSVQVPQGFSASEIRLIGNVVGEPPFRGTLSHAGWRATKIELPKLSQGYDVRVIAPAEVEL